MPIYSILSIIPTETYLIITADVMLHYSKKETVFKQFSSGECEF